MNTYDAHNSLSSPYWCLCWHTSTSNAPHCTGSEEANKNKRCKTIKDLRKSTRINVVIPLVFSNEICEKNINLTPVGDHKKVRNQTKIETDERKILICRFFFTLPLIKHLISSTKHNGLEKKVSQSSKQYHYIPQRSLVKKCVD